MTGNDGFHPVEHVWKANMSDVLKQLRDQEVGSVRYSCNGCDLMMIQGPRQEILELFIKSDLVIISDTPVTLEGEAGFLVVFAPEVIIQNELKLNHTKVEGDLTVPIGSTLTMRGDITVKGTLNTKGTLDVKGVFFK